MSAQDGKLTVLHVLPFLGPTNGQYHEHCLPLMHERRIVVCSLLGAAIQPPSAIKLFAGDGTRRGAWRSLLAALRAEEYDVIHAHAPASGALLLAALLRARRSPANCVFTMQNSYRNYRRRNRLLLYPILAFYPDVVLCSGAVRESLPRPLAFLARRKADVVANAVDTDRVRHVLSSAPTGESREGLTVVSVGRLIDIKDPRTLLDAFTRAQGPGDRLVFVGDGHLRPALVDAVARAGLDSRVTFTGLAPRDDVYRHVAAGDVYVSTSHGEGMPVAVLEAMACGRPVILSDIPPHREIAQDAAFIPLVAPGDTEGFAREIARLRDLPPQERASIGAACQRIVEQRYGVAAMHRSLQAVYSRAVRRGRRAGEVAA
jgi:glycosyltransferase involved in cell wall biosynthesis